MNMMQLLGLRDSHSLGDERVKDIARTTLKKESYGKRFTSDKQVVST